MSCLLQYSELFPTDGILITQLNMQDGWAILFLDGGMLVHHPKFMGGRQKQTINQFAGIIMEFCSVVVTGRCRKKK